MSAPKPITIAPLPLAVIWIVPTDQCACYLRRLIFSSKQKCPKLGDYGCDASVFIGNIPTPKSERGYIEDVNPKIYDEDPRWPTVCEACGQPFGETAERQVIADEIYVGTNGVRKPFREWRQTPGAMWNEWWIAERGGRCGPDGMYLTVVCPDGQQWSIDSRASNCTMKNDNTHRCWTRKGTPPLIDVTKNYGPTCQAGAGSIQTDHWHGYLRNGFFTLTG